MDNFLPSCFVKAFKASSTDPFDINRPSSVSSSASSSKTSFASKIALNHARFDIVTMVKKGKYL